MAARYVKEIAELSEEEQNFEKASIHFEKAAELFPSGRDINFCQPMQSESGSIWCSVGRELDPTFSGTREYKFLQDLAAAIDEEDVTKFTDVVKELDNITQLDLWKTTLLLRVKEAVKAKEMEEDDLT